MRACRPPSCRPASPDQRVFYTVLECQPLFDSSDMTITEWVQIAQIIEVTRECGEGGGSGVGDAHLSSTAPATLSPTPWRGRSEAHAHLSSEEMALVAVSL